MHAAPSLGLTAVHVAILSINGQRVFAKLDREANANVSPEEMLAGQKVRLLVKDDGDQYFQLEPAGIGFGGILDRVARRVGFTPARIEPDLEDDVDAA